FDYRRKRGRAACSLECPAEVVANTPSEDVWFKDLRGRLVRHALAQIRDEFRPRTWQCFLLHALEGRNAEDVSRDVGVSTNAVYINSSRVMSRLREVCNE